MMQTFLFDDKGELWDGKSRQLADALHASLSSEDLLKYVVRNLGFIAITENSGSLWLQLRPAIVSQMALGGLLYWMHDRAVERVLISSLDEAWSHELVASREAAVRRLLERVSAKPTDREGDFLSRPRPVDDLPQSSPLRALLNAWSECSGKYDRERLHRLLYEDLNGRFLLVEPLPDASSLLVKEIGLGFGNHAVHWLSHIRGLRVEDQPDYAYGQWIASLYRQTLEKRTPSLQDVDAVIRWPHQPRASYRYQRLMVPFEAGPNSTLVLGATVLDAAIDLRVKPS